MGVVLINFSLLDEDQRTNYQVPLFFFFFFFFFFFSSFVLFDASLVLTVFCFAGESERWRGRRKRGA